jgi:hypothetical protein
MMKYLSEAARQTKGDSCGGISVADVGRSLVKP